MLIFLCGMMGAGKTTIGKKIAFKLNLPFIDLDQHIEKKEQTSIISIFSAHGENYFRNLETKYLHQVIDDNINGIISLGGGTPCFNNNIKLINNKGISVFINTDINKLVNRLWYAKSKRPLTQNMTTTIELKEFIDKKLKERLPYYLSCKYEIDGSADSVNNFIKDQLMKL